MSPPVEQCDNSQLTFRPIDVSFLDVAFLDAAVLDDLVLDTYAFYSLFLDGTVLDA